MDFWRRLPPRMRLLVVTGFVALMVAVGAQFHVSSQGDRSSTYPKGYRGGTCTIETDALLVGYSAYFIPSDYEIPDDPTSAKAVPVLCGKVPSPGTLNVTLDLLYPESVRHVPLALRLIKLSDKNGEQELLSIPPQAYASGTLTQAFRFDAVGQYALYLDGKRPGGTEFELQIPIKVGTDWKDYVAKYWPQALVFLFIVIVLVNWKRIFG
ncbi:hypothetical protein SAMN05216403_102118 [Nitrosospira multiformis ATCC 25196]|uniref:Uncharacterized protein n=1 Tax=Nitrosospira multiformis (strain ATCC 25196 / NCIMB 11849 / C 71) TaxID=323848 RepID=Q2YAH3_NITMU|nr:hypothetical protein [Nitrosospira multiformis]ABB74248.1 conserved hypothetical protein [Nitrosospira multiformis ATCC 25196]SEF48647.1 hypothetical protein SAMN05216403_102118 [Nitrosospira multiformis ATCC 25196]